MKINSFQALTNTNSFKGANISINAISDTHGELKKADCALEEMRAQKNDIFLKEKKGNKNVFVIGGDWFMDGGRTGFASDVTKNNSDFQLKLLNFYIREIKKLAPDTDTIFVPGNHEFDGGVKLFDSVLSKLHADILMTNLDMEKSTGLGSVKVLNPPVKKKIIETEDDKNPDLVHKVLFLGISPVNMYAYQKKLDGISLINNAAKSQRNVKQEDYKETLEECKKIIGDFKSENPKGAVVLISHTGVNFAENLIKESDVDLVLNAHEHKSGQKIINDTLKVELNQIFNEVINSKLKFDDDGNLESIEAQTYSPMENREAGPLNKLYKKILRGDLENRFMIIAPDEKIKTLDIKNVRSGNNYLANFITDSVLEELNKTNSSNADFFALNASAIRHPLPVENNPSINSFDIMNVLAGITDEDAKIILTKVDGRQMIELIQSNYEFSKDNPERNPIIHYAGLIIDRTNFMRDLAEGKSYEELAKNVIVEKTQKPIELDKTYTIANVEKYFNKTHDSKIKELKKTSQYTPYTLQKLFRKHFEDAVDGKLYAKCDERLK